MVNHVVSNVCKVFQEGKMHHQQLSFAGTGYQNPLPGNQCGQNFFYLSKNVKKQSQSGHEDIKFAESNTYSRHTGNISGYSVYVQTSHA